MGDKSKIEWTDATWNPIRGCSVVSEGCRNCYAMQVAARFSEKGQAYEGLAYRNGSGAHWAGKVRLVEEHLEDPLRWKRPRRIFVNSMSDLFHESIPDDWILDIFRIMETAQRHVFQVLTKRPLRMVDFINRRHASNAHRCPASNVWLGVSCEDQKTAEERIPLLLQTPAAVRWLSAEPLLGLIDISHWVATPVVCNGGSMSLATAAAMKQMAQAVVRGQGFNLLDWVHSLRDQCLAAGVPFFFKQWGEWSPDFPQALSLAHRQERYFEKQNFYRVGKKAAGRMLDGREWNQYPDIAMGGA